MPSGSLLTQRKIKKLKHKCIEDHSYILQKQIEIVSEMKKMQMLLNKQQEMISNLHADIISTQNILLQNSTVDSSTSESSSSNVTIEQQDEHDDNDDISTLVATEETDIDDIIVIDD